MGFFSALIEKFSSKPVDWDELEEMLIRADFGVPITMRIIEKLKERQEKLTANDVIAVTQEEVINLLPSGNTLLRPFPAKPKVILMVGVNGTGKTTSTAKLAHALRAKRYSVLMVAADTFRAAAIEQLELWSQRIGVELIKAPYRSDSAALCYHAYQSAHTRDIEFVICDTAGRLHTKHNLMQELAKIRRVLGNLDPDAPSEVFMVLDATTGSNALAQTREFHKAMNLTGIIVTKLDGSGKGGSIIAIQEELGIPARFIGTGEQIDNFQPFDAQSFVKELL